MSGRVHSQLGFLSSQTGIHYIHKVVGVASRKKEIFHKDPSIVTEFLCESEREIERQENKKKTVSVAVTYDNLIPEIKYLTWLVQLIII